MTSEPTYPHGATGFTKHGAEPTPEENDALLFDFAAHRRQIDMIDELIIILLADRAVVTTEIMKAKRALRMPPEDRKRVMEQEARYKQLAAVTGAEPGLVLAVFMMVRDVACRAFWTIKSPPRKEPG